MIENFATRNSRDRGDSRNNIAQYVVPYGTSDNIYKINLN